jgi:hypothetical protein
VAVGALVVGALAACSSPPSLEDVGGPCFQVIDCKLGLVCVPKADGTRACSSDLSSITGTGAPATAPAEAAAPPALGADEAGADGAGAVPPQGDEGGDEGALRDSFPE